LVFMRYQASEDEILYIIDYIIEWLYEKNHTETARKSRFGFPGK
jgi:hypothetical protein